MVGFIHYSENINYTKHDHAIKDIYFCVHKLLGTETEGGYIIYGIHID